MSAQTALVTGSSRGIGLAAALALVKRGFAVALNGPQDDAELDAAVASVVDAGGRAVKAPFDVADLAAHGGALERLLLQQRVAAREQEALEVALFERLVADLPLVDPDPDGLDRSLRAGDC